jgi:acyl-CoA synthetase (NDP forming)
MRDLICMPSALERLFRPKNVAVVGASRTPGKQGNTALRHLIRGGFKGGIFPVNPSGEEIEGRPCFKSIAEVPVPIDCAILVVPPSAAVETVRACGAAGIGAAIVASTGFVELGTDEGRARQAALLEAARTGGVRLVGPNTNGVYNASDLLCLGYNTSFGEALCPGPVSIASHSGALFNSVFPRLRQYGAGLSKYVPVGNEADLDMLDFLEFFIADPDTEIIGLIIEGLRDGARFRALAARAHAAGKPIVALKLGRSRAGAGAALAHSSRLAGSARAYDALFRACGVATVPTVEALAGAAAILRAGRGTKPLVCISSSGGGSSLLADHAEARGIPLAGTGGGEWGGKVAAAVARMEGASDVRNPTDISALGGLDRLDAFFRAQESDGFDGPVVFFTHLLPNVERSKLLADQLVARKTRTKGIVVVCAPGGLTAEIEAAYRSAAIPQFADLATCFDALATIYATPPEAAAYPPRALPADALVAGDDLETLRRAGIATVETREASDACPFPFPAVLKAMVPGVAHKAKEGLVVTGIGDANAYSTALDRLRRHRAPVIVQPQLSFKAELILGIVTEPGLGKFLLLGLGGVHTEILDEIVLWPIPSAPDLGHSRVGRLITALGATEAVADALMRLQDVALAAGDSIESIDVNPLLVTADGAIAVDALIVRR